jgi:hypothetical protein
MQYRKAKELTSYCRINDDGSMLEVTRSADCTLVVRDRDMSHRDDVLDDKDWEDATQEEFEAAHKQAMEEIHL